MSNWGEQGERERERERKKKRALHPVTPQPASNESPCGGRHLVALHWREHISYQLCTPNTSNTTQSKTPMLGANVQFLKLFRCFILSRQRRQKQQQQKTAPTCESLSTSRHNAFGGALSTRTIKRTTTATATTTTRKKNVTLYTLRGTP